MSKKNDKKNQVKNEKLVLLDMHAILHRGYHALPDFQTSSGEHTGALYGLVLMLLSVIEAIKPKYIAACFDLPKPTHRHELYADYKVTRKKPDDELITQITRSREILDAFSIPYYESAGFEADDLLGTICEQLKTNNNVDIVIASGDHDTLQLIDEQRVQVYTLKRGIKDTVLYDEAGVIEKYGFGPELLTDYKGLRGDPSDNIPGVAGVGDKTARQLLEIAGSLEEAIRLANEEPEKLKEAKIRPGIISKLQEQSDIALFSKALATIRLDAPIEFSLTNATWQANFDAQTLFEVFDNLQFRSVKQRVLKILNLEDKQQTLDLGASAKLDISKEEARKLMEESKLMVWLLHSDQTNPEADEVYRVGSSNNLTVAHQNLFEQIKENNLEQVYEKIEKPLIAVIEKMNKKGITLDQDFLKNLSAEYGKLLSDLETKIHKLSGVDFNVSSPKQLGEVLFEKMKLPKAKMKKTSRGDYSTAEGQLEKLKNTHEIIPLILEHRELNKLINTYIEALPKLTGPDGRLRATFLQAGTTTGRMASRTPNMQNIPIRTDRGSPIRKAFVAEPEKQLVSVDYSQIELRIAAWLSGDESLTEVFKDNQDIHSVVAAQIFDLPLDKVTTKERAAAKTINFGILYGMGANALRSNLGDDVSKEEATEYIERYFSSYPQLAKYLEETKNFARSYGYTLTHFGRRRYFTGIRSRVPYLRAAAERMAINAPIQGTQADIIKLAMVQVNQYLEENNLEEKVSLLLQVHDELVFEVDKDFVSEIIPKIVSIMEGVLTVKDTGGIKMKAEAKAGPNWGEMKRI